MNPVLITISGDSAPSRDFYFKRTDGTIPDLTDCEVIFKIYDPETKHQTNSANNVCTVIDGPGGVAQYIWNIATDVPNPGIYPANLVILYTDGRQETALVKIAVGNHIPQ